MLLQKLTEEELEFMENWYNPVCQAESLFSNFDDLGEFHEDKLAELRTYQLPMISYESLIDTNIEGLDAKQRFQLKKNVGDLYNLGARKYGKTLITLRLDIALSILYDDRAQTAIYSIDEKRLRGVLDKVRLACEHHPIIKLWEVKCSYKPELKFFSPKNRWLCQGINMTIKGKSPGDQFYQLHAVKLWGEEVSFETKEVYDKRIEAFSELGAVVRMAGMTNFTKHSPIGKVFCDLKNKSKIVNLPQYVNPFWDEKEKKDRLEAYGGEDTINYRVFVKGEVVEDGISEFDMERVRQCYLKKEIKKFEISKERLARFRDLIVVERPKNADRIFINTDVGDNQTEIVVMSEVGDKYSYLYNISLYGLIKDEQEEIIKWLIEKLEANIVAIDCGDAFGRILADGLEKTYSKDNVVRYAGVGKINVDFEKDSTGKIVMQKGKPAFRQEYMSEWAVRRLKTLLYNERIRLPLDYQFDVQFNAVISTQSGTRRIYKCVNDNDHLFDAFKVFAIAQWLKKDFNQTKPMTKEWGIGV